jgi:hypothetical protein
MTAAGCVWRANPPPVRPRRPTSRPATGICLVCPANDARPAWAIRWAAAVTPRYSWHEACAAGPCIYNLAFDRHPLLADTLEEAMCIDAGILAHCCEPGEHVLRVLPPAAASVSQWATVESGRRCRRTNVASLSQEALQTSLESRKKRGKSAIVFDTFLAKPRSSTIFKNRYFSFSCCAFWHAISCIEVREGFGALTFPAGHFSISRPF